MMVVVENLHSTKDKETIINRSRCIVDKVSKGPLRPHEVIDCLLMPEACFHHVFEDIALGRIFRGYENMTVDKWVVFYFFNICASNSGSYCVVILIEPTVGYAYEAIKFFFQLLFKMYMSLVEPIDEHLWLRQQVRRSLSSSRALRSNIFRVLG